MAISTFPKVKRDGQVTLKDNAGALSTILTYEDGDVSFDGVQSDRIVIRDRGVIVGVRKGDDPVIKITFTVTARQFTNAAAGSVIDMIEFSGGWAAATSTTDIASDFNIFTAEFQMEGTTPDGADHVATFLGCVGTWNFSEGDPNKIKVTLECHGGKPTRTGP